MNQFGDMTMEEMQLYIHPKRTNAGQFESEAIPHVMSGKPSPSYVNWVTQGGVNPPKDQGTLKL